MTKTYTKKDLEHELLKHRTLANEQAIINLLHEIRDLRRDIKEDNQAFRLEVKEELHLINSKFKGVWSSFVALFCLISAALLSQYFSIAHINQ